MMIWGLVIVIAVVLGGLPIVFGLLGIVASAVIWIGLFVTLSVSMTKQKMRLFANWGPFHLAAIVMMPFMMMASIYAFPGALGF